jgi:hypothetical protein
MKFKWLGDGDESPRRAWTIMCKIKLQLRMIEV